MPRNCARALAWAAGLLCWIFTLQASVPALAQTPPAQTPLENILKAQPSTDRAVVRAGQATQAEGGPVAESAVGRAADEAAKPAPEPFGASLFKNGPPGSSDVVNPDYKIQPGDRISL